ncbi:DUF4244 domain-containing protein [Georgenia sp. Z1344]|uniref:DUF4244 domain-containing protein n=1 Tax=Georgenia sp. Z1344 TaxID=3416706 RepID=UPI003CFA77B6
MHTITQAAHRLSTTLRSRHELAAEDPEAGMATAEYAIGTVAAAGLAAALIGILNGDAVISMVTGLITRALGV